MATPVNAINIQGDILAGGFAKKTETFVFFQITDSKKFIEDLVKLVPIIKTVQQVLEDREAISKHKSENKDGLVKVAGVNISFSYSGLRALGISDERMEGTSLTNDQGVFKNGALNDAVNLNDPMLGDKPNWNPEFLEQIDGVLLFGGDSHESVNEKITQVFEIFGVDVQGTKPSIRTITKVVGDVRPGDQDGHEHFGFHDGISNPLIAGFDSTIPGPLPIDAKFILTGHDDVDSNDWTKDGSFFVFRYLSQQVPEFNNFLKQNALKTDPLTGRSLSVAEGSELLGARLVGRWKSGAPVDITPFRDDPTLGNDPNRNNNFSYFGELLSNNRCPWAAHLRRTNPREDSIRIININALNNRRIMRRGITFGPEVTEEEKSSGITRQDRGLLFTCYQANIETAFRFIQTSWSNNPKFPFVNPFDLPPLHEPGIDPIIGQVPKGTSKQIVKTRA